MLSSDGSSEKLTCRLHHRMQQSTYLLYLKFVLFQDLDALSNLSASSYPGFDLSEGQINLQQPMVIAPLTDL